MQIYLSIYFQLNSFKRDDYLSVPERSPSQNKACIFEKKGYNILDVAAEEADRLDRLLFLRRQAEEAGKDPLRYTDLLTFH